MAIMALNTSETWKGRLVVTIQHTMKPGRLTDILYINASHVTFLNAQIPATLLHNFLA